MNANDFIGLVYRAVTAYVNSSRDLNDKAPLLTEEDCYIVWLSKVLQNNKALVGTTIPDGMYYEVTYNGDKSELYVDVYKKWENIRLEVRKREQESETPDENDHQA